MNINKLSVLWVLVMKAWCNIVQNGQFESPLLAGMYLGSFSEEEFANHWVGRYQLIGITFELNGLIFSPPFMGSNQCIDLTVDSPTYAQEPGYVSQNLSLEKDGIYSVSYRWALLYSSGLPESFQLTTLWDGQTIDVLNPTVKTPTLQTFQFQALTGNHVLQFLETKYSVEVIGFLIDSIFVDYSRPLPSASQQQSTDWPINVLVAAGTFPRNLHGLKSIMLIVDDLWLYVYDDRQYNWLMKSIFDTISKVQTLKWSYLSYHQALPDLQNSLKISNYQNYSNPKYMVVENQDGSFVRSLTLYFTITIPQTIILCLIMRGLFNLISQYQISIFLRRYCFLPNFLQIILEPNVGYLTYLFFNQAKILFSFSFVDKFFIALAVTLYAFVILFSILFFALVSQFYEKKAGYFLLNFFRVPRGVFYATIRINVRSLLYGALHSLLYTDYFTLMLSLTSLEFGFLLFAIIMEMIEQVYITRIQFVLGSLYHAIFILLNISLFFQKHAEEESLQTGIFQYFDKHILSSLAIVATSVAVLDFIPMECLQIKRLSLQEMLAEACQISIDKEENNSDHKEHKKRNKDNHKIIKFTNIYALKKIESNKKTPSPEESKQMIQRNSQHKQSRPYEKRRQKKNVITKQFKKLSVDGQQNSKRLNIPRGKNTLPIKRERSKLKSNY